MCLRPASGQRVQHLVLGQHLVFDQVGQLVQHNQPVPVFGKNPFGEVPALAGGGGIFGQVIGFPCEAPTHDMEVEQVAETFRSGQLAVFPAAFDELDEADPPAVAERAQGQAKGGGGFAFAFAGVDDQQPFAPRVGWPRAATAFLVSGLERRHFFVQKLHFRRKILHDVFSGRRTASAALRPWRKENLETLITRLQFSQWREDAFAAIDILRESAAENESLRFLLHRIDARKWKYTPDKENNRILFETAKLEPDLKETQQKIENNKQISDRFVALSLWADEQLECQKQEHEYYQSWSQALAEARELYNVLENLDKNEAHEIFIVRNGSCLITAAAVFIRDYCSELSEEDAFWCAGLIIQAVIRNADTDNELSLADVTDYDGSAAAASVLPILLDITSNDNERLKLKCIIVIALTHANENVRRQAANGIREYLWQRDQEFAEKCIAGAIKYARFEKEHELETRRIYFETNEDREVAKIQWQAKKDAFRDIFARGELGNELEQITFATHSSWCILPPCLMIPDGSREPEHVVLFSQMLWLFFAVE